MKTFPVRLALCLLALWVLQARSDAAPATKPPNVLLIIADDLNDWIGPMKGHPQVKTPNLDRLAARGVTFMNAHCAAPICNPSRTAMFSGKRPSTTGVYHNQQQWMKHIPAGICLNDYLRGQGFKSLASGKIFHYRNYKPEEWDEVTYFTDDTLPRSVAKRTPGIFGYRMFTEGEPEGEFQEKRAESKLVDFQSVTWCSEKLATQKERFFMACGLHRPHTPWDVPKKYFDLYPLDQVQLPPVLTNDLSDVPSAGVAFAKPKAAHAAVTSQGLWKDRVRAYLAATSFADAQVGRLLDALEKSAHRDNTMIIFVGDNGWHLGEKEHWAKSALWREATVVPLIWVAPGVAPAGKKCEAAVDLMSVYPTVCELAGVPVPKHVDGISIKPLLEDPSREWKQPAIVTHLPGNNAAVTAQWRYIKYSDGTEELYDVRKDPNEWTNLAAKPELARVKQELAAYMPAKNAPPVPSQPARPARRGARAAQPANDAEAE